METLEETSIISSSIIANDICFANLIKLIPSELYKHKPHEPPASSQVYYKHRRLPLQPAEKKLLSLKHRAGRYGNDEIEGEEEEIDSDDEANDKEDIEDDDEAVADMEGSDDEEQETESSSSSNKKDMSGLKARLQERIRDGQFKRSNNTPSKNSNKANEISAVPIVKPVTSDIRSDLLSSAADGSIEDSGDVSFAWKESGINEDHDGKPGNKKRRLKRMLDEVESKRRRMEVLESLGDSGKESLMKEKWSSVLDKASGHGSASLEDATKIKKALKRMDAKKMKSAQQWKERLEAVEQEKEAKVAQKEANIANRHNHGANSNSTAAATSTSTGNKKIALHKPGSGGNNHHGKGHVHGGSNNHNNNNNNNNNNSSTSGSHHHSNSHHQHHQHHGSSNHSGSSSGNGNHARKNRAGFEGKKQGFLNEKSNKK